MEPSTPADGTRLRISPGGWHDTPWTGLVEGLDGQRDHRRMGSEARSL